MTKKPRIFIETPITETDGLEDGWYIMPTSMSSSIIVASGIFRDGKWIALPRTPIGGYLRPLPEGTVLVSREDLYGLLSEINGMEALPGEQLEKIVNQFVTTKLAQMGDK